MPLLDGSAISSSSPRSTIPIVSRAQASSSAAAATAATPLGTVSPVQSTKPVGHFLQSLLGITLSNYSDPHDPHPIDLVHGGLVAPRLPPPEPYEFREMTLGCRFVTTDQWLTTRVDTSWTVFQVKLHMLTKLLGARRDQLKILSHPSESHSESTESHHPASTHDDKTIATSNQSSIIFALHESSDLDSLNHSPTPRYHPLPRPVERESFDTKSDVPSHSSFTQSVPTIYQGHLFSQTDTLKGIHTDRHVHNPNLGAATAPPGMMEPDANNVNKEDVLDELLDQLVKDAKEGVHKVADKYCLMSYSCGNILDDRMTLTECRLRPFELLEMQEKSRFLKIPRRAYLDTYWESPVAVRMRGGGELQGIEGINKLAKVGREEKKQQKLQRDLVAEFTSNPLDEAREESRSMVAPSILSRKDTAEARARDHEEKRRKLMQKYEQEEAKRQKREVKEAAMERWKERLAIVEGHQLNVWKNRDDDYPEQSWDLRRVVEVSVPKRRKQPDFPPGSVAAAYAALKNSNALNIIRVTEKQKGDVEEDAKDKQLHHDFHIRFSIPLSSVHDALDPAGAAAKTAARLKRELKRASKSPGLRHSASVSKLPFNSLDPFNQGVGFGTGTLDGAGSATLVLRLPDERSLENLSRIVHRAAGKYPLSQKRRRGGALSEGGRREEVTHPDAMDAATSMITQQETKFHLYPEWRERMLRKCVASGRHGFLMSPAWEAKFNPNTGEYESPRRLQRWRENEVEENEGEGAGAGEGEGEETQDEEESEPESLMSDAEWEGWRRELELETPTRPSSPGLKISPNTSPWTSETTQQSFVTGPDGLLQSRKRKNTLVSGRDEVLEEIVQRTTEHSVHPYSMLRTQPSGVFTSSSVSPSASLSVVMGVGASSSAGLDRAALCASSPSISEVISPRQNISVPGRARSATISTPNTAPKPTLHDTPDTNHDIAVPLAKLPHTEEGRRLPGLGGGLTSSSGPYHTVTTISVLRADIEPAPKKSMARVWSNKGKRRDRIEDLAGEEEDVEASIENAPLAVEHPDDAWARSYDEGLNRLRHMSSPDLRRSTSKRTLFSLLER